MKKVLLSFIVFTAISLSVLADDKQEALQFFNNYVKAANTYSTTIPDMYSPSAKIIRQVVKPICFNFLNKAIARSSAGAP